MAKLQWRRYRKANPLPDHIIDGVEMLLGVEFPKSYRELVKVFHGAVNEQTFSVRRDGEEWTNSVGELLSLDPYEKVSIFSWLARLMGDEAEEGYPQLRRVVPIAHDGGECWLCLDYRDVEPGQEPKVAHWLRELHMDEGLVPVADNFNAFLKLLQ